MRFSRISRLIGLLARVIYVLSEALFREVYRDVVYYYIDILLDCPVSE